MNQERELITKIKSLLNQGDGKASFIRAVQQEREDVRHLLLKTALL